MVAILYSSSLGFLHFHQGDIQSLKKVAILYSSSLGFLRANVKDKDVFRGSKKSQSFIHQVLVSYGKTHMIRIGRTISRNPLFIKSWFLTSSVAVFGVDSFPVAILYSSSLGFLHHQIKGIRRLKNGGYVAILYSSSLGFLPYPLF